MRPIREAAVQFLYCLHLEGEEKPQPSVDSAFWDSLLEQDEVKLAKARTKAILFIAQGREARLEKLEKHTESAIEQLRIDEKSESFRSALLRVLNLEQQLTKRLFTLNKDNQQTKHSDAIDLQAPIEAVFTTDRDLVASRKSCQQMAADFPTFKVALEPVFGAMNRLQRISDRFHTIKNPREFPSDNATKHLAADEARIEEIKSGATQMAAAVLENVEQLDGEIAKVVENFDPARLNPVDRAIMRLATWEMLHCSKVPNPVAINEAVAIAKRYSTSSSASFVNGVLDSINKAQASD